MPVKCSGKILVAVLGVFLSGSVCFGAYLNVDGTINAADAYDKVVNDNDPVPSDFTGSGSDIKALHFGVALGPTHATDPTDVWYTFGMTVVGPSPTPQINTTGDGTGASAPTSARFSIKQGGSDKYMIHVTMFYGNVLNVTMWNTSTATPTQVPLNSQNLKYKINAGLELAIQRKVFTNLAKASPFDFKLLFEGGGQNKDDVLDGQIPEPATMSMLLVGSIVFIRRRRRK
ncbi:MAG: PEP-CTERM sorting domain-containing protein [bacterium]|nr:PEP-CTERM sorting domain-containing protein [bacterium]